MRKYSIVETIFPKVSEHEENINNPEKKVQKDKRIEIFKGEVSWPKKKIEFSLSEMFP